MNDWWVISIYEVENAHTDPMSCLSMIKMCLCVWETVWEQQKIEKKVKREVRKQLE